MAALGGLAHLLEESGRRTEAAPLRDEAAALLRTCPDPGRAATLLADDPRLPRQRAPEAGEELTARVVAVLQLLPTQKSLRTIAADLYVSHNTGEDAHVALPQARGLDEGGGRPAGQGGGPAVAGLGR